MNVLLTAFETYNKFQDEDGCPDSVTESFVVDSDNDGIHDVDDDCPLVAENFNGFQDTDGCPDVDDTQPDSDGDGVADNVDLCPTQNEVWNRYVDYDGCPDILPVGDMSLLTLIMTA